LKILYLGGVGPFGGASRSLYEAVGGLPPGEVEAHFLMPRGTALDFYRRVARDTLAVSGISRFDHTRATHYRGLRWVVLLRELLYLPATRAGLLAARRRWPRIDIVHVNEFTELAPAIRAKRLFGARLVVHVRSLVNDDIGLRRTRWLQRALRRHADAVIAIDETVRATLPSDIPVDVIHNSFTPTVAGAPDEAYLAQFDRLRPTSLKVGFVGNLLRIKGIFELAEAARLVRQAGADVQFIVVGGGLTRKRDWKTRAARLLGLVQDVAGDIRELIADLGIEEDFLLFGATNDIQRAYPRMDVLAFPSHFDAPGRPVFEAAFFGVPSIVAVRDPKPDTIVDGETGIAIPEPDARLLADAILQLANDRDEGKRMGMNAKRLAERNFVPETNSRALLDVYRRLMARPVPGGA
jgi:glycosyltransferase involved in cell wall biosynthesis